MTGHVCAECGGHRPGCACARAAELAAEVAAAEDFDPLRIRPYVTLEAAETGDAGSGGRDPAGGGGGVGGEDPPTARLTAVRPEDVTGGMYGDAGTYGADGSRGADAGSYRAGRPEAYEVGPEPYGGGAGDETRPVLLGGVGAVGAVGAAGVRDGAGPRRRGARRGGTVVLVSAAAVAGTAALAAAVLGFGGEREDRAAVPEVTTSASLNVAVSEAPSTATPSSEGSEPSSAPPSTRESSASPSGSATPTASDSPSTSASPSGPSPGPATASPSASGTSTAPGAPAGPASTGPAAPTTGTGEPSTRPVAPPPPEETEEPTEEPRTLDYGDSGAEVRELQERLTDVGAYSGPLDGEYDQGVWRAVKAYQSWMYIQDDPRGVYGPATREVLERNTPHI